MHISDEVRAALIQRGFCTSDATTYKRTTQTARIDPTGRWLERVDGWGNVERDCDLRDYAGRAASAVDTVLA